MMVATSSAGRQRSGAGEHASEKRSLASILRDHGPIPVTDAVDIALDVCDELANAHANGIVHGDLGMHRVRTHWPRVPGQRVDIFALGENDSAAFAFRASAVAGLVAPEQRENRPVDRRVDVWAVGAMLHWMIAGAAPSSDPNERTLAKAPCTLVIAIEACLAIEPNERPRSVNELAEVIASFASSPPDRFEQLAQRRSRLADAKRVRSDLGDVESVLGRLDDAALQRELVAASTPPALDRLAVAVDRSTGSRSSAIFEKTHLTDLADDDQQDVETVLAQPRYVPGMAAEEALPPVASPLSIAPVILSSELLAPPKDAALPVEASAPLRDAPRSTRRRTVVGIIGAAFALSLGVGIGMRLVERALARQVALSAPPAAPVSPARAAPAPTDAVAAAPTPAAHDAVVTPASLPDARPAVASPIATSSAVADVRPVTPASLPDAKPSPAPVVRVSRPKESAPAATEPDKPSAEDATEAAPTSLTDAL